MKLERALALKLTQAGQQTLIDHCESLDDVTAADLVAQLETIDFDLVARLREEGAPGPPAHHEIEPLPYVPYAERGSKTEIGEAELRGGRVAFALLAGGQASRLQWDGPKGSFGVGPVSERSLFQILVEQIVRAGRDYGRLPRLAVTTSATTDAAIRTFFERHNCFGMDRERLAFARQASLPALDDEGRFMLASAARIFTSPDGHGGAVYALERDGLLEQWANAGVTTVCTFQVDNPLLRVVDADFIGELIDGDAPIATKIILKRDPEEKLGVVCRADGRPSIVEYSEISDEMARQRDPDGQLTFRLGSIAVHAFDIAFLRRELGNDLPLHTAHKQIPCLGDDGQVERRQGIKFERFLFDLFPRAGSLRVVEVLREREYSPVKRPEGKESPATCRADLDAEYRRWYSEAGREPPEGEFIELSPLDALGPEDLTE
jgi:UDP-N-acetylglucosamine/UDP-N-acetylgalactosamine diphosphorylase